MSAELKKLLTDCLDALGSGTDCADPCCPCEGNDETKRLALRLLKAIEGNGGAQ